MIFYSLTFALFFLLVTFFVHLTKTCKRQQIVFLLANIIFYAYWDVRFLLLLATVILSCYCCAKLYEDRRKNFLIIIPIVYCLEILYICKYFNFFIESFCQVLGINSTHTLNIILPLGISFYIFQALSYILDVKRGVISAERNVIKLAAYISFFPPNYLWTYCEGA